MPIDADESPVPIPESLRRKRFDLRLGVVSVAATYAIVGAVVTLLGWALDNQRLTDWVNTGIAMFPNTALCAGMAGVALLLLAYHRPSELWRTAVRFLAIFIAVIGGLTLLEHISGLNFGIDTLLFDRPWGQRAAAAPMRMGPPGSTSFLVLGAGLLLATGGQRARWLASVLAILPVAISSLSIIGYWFGSDHLYSIVHLTGIAIQTSTILAMLGVGLMAAVPEHGIVSLLCRDDAGGMLARRLWLPIIAVPLFLGRLRLLGEEVGLFDRGFGLSVLLLATIAMLLALLVLTATSISRAAQANKHSHDQLETFLKKDIRDRMQTEKALREREQRYELVLVGAEAAIWDWDVSQNRVMYSPRWKQLRGLSDIEISDSEEEWSKRIHPEDRDRVTAALQAHFEGRTPVFSEEYRVQHLDGRWIWIHDRGIARRDEEGRVVRMAGSETDITERKRAEDELRQAEKRMRSVLNHVVDAIITIDESGTINSFNPAAEKLFGYRSSSAIGQNVKLLMPEPYHAQHDGYLHNYLTTGLAKIIGIGREVIGKRKDGSIFPMELAVSTFNIGARRFFTGIVRDITERKHLEDQLQQRVKELAEADNRKNEFLATLAHELRNPLAPIMNTLQLVRMKGIDDLAASGLQEIMERQVNHMVRLVDDLLELSRINNGKINLRREPVEITGVLQSAIETSKPLIEAGRHQLKLTVPPEPLKVVGDAVRLSQVVANLLNNAAKYTEPGGQIWLAASSENGDVSISVRDSGIGIAPNLLPELFQMFSQADRDQQRSQGGLGIGLALAKNLVELHGGRIEAHSEGAGRGSEFIIQLPLAQGQPQIVDGSAFESSVNGPSTHCRVLVVDDNRDAARSLALLLRALGNEVQTAFEGPAALDAIQAFQPSMVLLDLGMPGMSGYEVAVRARAMPEGRECMLVALTGWGQEEDRRRSREAGFDHHLLKPVEVEELKTLLSESQVPSPFVEEHSKGERSAFSIQQNAPIF